MKINFIKDIHLLTCEQTLNSIKKSEIKKLRRIKLALWENPSQNRREIDDDILSFLFSRYWRPSPYPRAVKYSKELLQQIKENYPQYSHIISSIKKEIELGMDLWPRLSRSVTKNYTKKALAKDKMFRRWQFHHLHLSPKNHQSREDLLASTKDLLFALIDHDAVYFIAIGNHQSLSNTEYDEFINIACSNWPKNNFFFNLRGVRLPEKEDLDNSHLQAAYDYNFNTLTSKGFIPQSFISSAGYPIKLQDHYSDLRKHILNMEKEIKIYSLKTGHYLGHKLILKKLLYDLNNRLTIKEIEGVVIALDQDGAIADFKISANSGGFSLKITPRTQ